MRESDLDILHAIVRTRGGFGHREHLELAWTFLSRYDVAEAQQAMVAAIRHLAGAHGMPERYHETITVTWVHLVAVHRERWDGANFDAFMARPENEPLLERRLLSGHYSAELMTSPEARAGWVAPDLARLPALA